MDWTLEIVVSAGLNVPHPLTPQDIETFVSETLVTTHEGRLIVTKSSYTVGQRAREIAVRMTLGARRSEVAKMIVGQAAMYVVVGVIFGLAGALAGTRLMTGLLFGVAATDPATLSSAAAVVIVTALAASSIPAIRAARTMPVAVLRPE